MQNELMQAIEKEKLIVILRGTEREKLLPLTQAMYDGGVRILEVTYSANGKFSDEYIAENIHMLAEEFKGRMYIGAGTVLTEKQVELTHQAGGQFIVSPNTCPAVIAKTKELGMVSIPGALTPTEIQNAHLAGADIIKLFPASVMGTSYIKAVKAPLSHVKLLATGGVNEQNMGEYFKAGICGIGVGSNIVDNKMLEANDWAGITALAEKFVSGVQGK